uniref:Retrovirus-related Pol polyprotein from transposon TNT 1-94 n=1 Tax=Cajanus cajan TaxID=3821 RepID=A0A151TBV7_CAJCA|nr:Retrovirus-related Pol polyprotein from transposon TNT 1-94 [Cajanus cajan]KYP64559.1 Retrovirus-related Pol polyprotein from transposon TNT 1-94 [Cajanus cajan]
MVQPPGFNSTHKGQVCKLNKAIYGLKQAPKSWFQTLSNTLFKMGFRPVKSDTFLLIRITPQSIMLILIYMNDIVTGNSKIEVTTLISKLNSMFSLKDVGPLHYILGIEVSPNNDGGLFLSQAKYIQDLLHRANMHDSKPLPTPMGS